MIVYAATQERVPTIPKEDLPANGMVMKPPFVVVNAPLHRTALSPGVTLLDAARVDPDPSPPISPSDGTAFGDLLQASLV